MALTVTFKGTPKPPGDRYYYKTNIALDASYPNPAGYVATPASFGLHCICNIVNVEPLNLPAAATWSYWIVPTYDAAGMISNVALHLAVVATGVEVGNGVDVHTASFAVTVEGW